MDSEEAKSRSIVIAGSFPSGMSSHKFFVCFLLLVCTKKYIRAECRKCLGILTVKFVVDMP